jgi:hypothetical protein
MHFRNYCKTYRWPRKVRHTSCNPFSGLRWTELNRNLLFDFKHGDNGTLIAPVRDIVKHLDCTIAPTV